MTLPVIDRDSRSTIAAAEGQAALAAGDTLRAREKYDEAGEILERKIGRTQKRADKHFFRFLAASQYYHGGNYPKALELCQRIEQRFLPPEVREPYPKFLQDVQARAAADYAPQVQRQLVNLQVNQEYERILELFQQHPFVLHPQRMAFGRAFACEELRKYRAAAAFYADFLRWTPGEPGVHFIVAATPLALLSEGRLEEAWEYVQHQLEMIPHAVTSMTASLLCYHRALTANTAERRQFYMEQIRHFEDAWREYRELPPKWSSRPDVRSLLALVNQAAAFGMLQLSDVDRENGERLFSQARELDPQNAELERSYRVFQEAKKQPDSDALPVWDLRRAHHIDQLLVAGRMDRFKAIADPADRSCLPTAQV
jgi:tetratricopeptide (TPR) repeat protein